MRGSHTKWSNSKASGKYSVQDTTRQPSPEIYRGNSIKEARIMAASVASARITEGSVRYGWHGIEEWTNGVQVKL